LHFAAAPARDKPRDDGANTKRDDGLCPERTVLPSSGSSCCRAANVAGGSDAADATGTNATAAGRTNAAGAAGANTAGTAAGTAAGTTAGRWSPRMGSSLGGCELVII